MANQKTTTFKPFTELTREERAALRMLTLDVQRSEFIAWLDTPNQQDKYAAYVTREGEIVGWAAANLGIYSELGVIGVYVHPRETGQGIASEALDVLVKNLAEQDKVPFYGLHCDKSRRLFRTPLEKHLYSSP